MRAHSQDDGTPQASPAPHGTGVDGTTTGEGRKAMVGGDERRHGRLGFGLVAALTALLVGYAVVRSPEPAPAAPAPAPAEQAETGPVRLSEAEAVAHAAKIDERVEVAASRSETHSLFANPDGSMTSVQYAQPVRVRRDGDWVPVDPELERADDGSYAPRAAAFGLRLSGGGDGPLLTAERAGRAMTLDWDGRLPAPSVEGDRATYREVLPGVDLVVNVGVTEFSHVLVIKSAEAARNSALATLDFGLRTEGLEVRETDTGGLAAVDVAAGGAVFEAGTPMMWDSGPPVTTPAAKARAQTADPRPLAPVEAAPGAAEQVPLDVAVTAGTLTLTPDQAMLTDPATRYPVYVDPLWTDTRAGAWAMVSSGFENEEYFRFSDDQGVGECPVSSGTCSGSGVKRIFYTLGTSLDDKTVLSAELSVTMTHTYDSSAKAVSVHHAKAGISAKTNWTNQPALGAKQDTKSPTATRSSCTRDNQNVRFDVKSIVSEAAAKNWSTTTFGLRADNESDHTAWKRFCGNALLEVRYNKAPHRAALKTLTQNPGGPCASRRYIDTPPSLVAILTDPDKTASNAEQLTAEFKISWTPAGGSAVTKAFTTGRKASGSKFSFNTNTAAVGLPQNTVIAWEVRGNDGVAAGPWSATGGQPRCEFILDRTSPTAPDIDSAEYLPLDAPDKTGTCAPDELPPDAEGEESSESWRGWVGRYGTFVFDSAATDVVEYHYGFDADPSPNNVLKPAAAGGAVSVTWQPQEDGPHTINVSAKDRVGKESVVASCTFHVATRLSAARWALTDSAGSAVADERGINPASAGGGVTFGVPGPACTTAGTCTIDRAIRLSGDADGHLTTTKAGPVVDTGAAFSVSAWVRLTDDAGDRVAVSQDGTGVPGFVLGFDGANRKWTFSTPSGPVRSLGGWASTSTAPAVKNRWTHLAGVYDPVKATVQLFVDGAAQSAAAKRSSWRSTGAVQLGRRLDRGGYRGLWAGDLADVQVFDRNLVAREAKEMAFRRPQRKAYWPLDEQVDDQSMPYDDHDGPELNLAGGAAVRVFDADTMPQGDRPMVGSGSLLLDGKDDHAATASRIATTAGSYTISVRTRISTAACTRTMTVISQSGTKESPFALRCSAANRWEAVLPQLDGADPDEPVPPVVLTGEGVPSADQSGQHLVLVYDALTREARLYVNGRLGDKARGSFVATWAANGPLQIGRGLRGSAYGDHFAGLVDDVRVYDGVANEAMIGRLGNTEAVPDL